MRAGSILFLVLLLPLATACPPPSPFIWPDQYRAWLKPTVLEYVVGHRQDEADSHAGTLGARLDRARRLS